MSNKDTKSSFKKEKTFRWESSIPDWTKDRSRPLKSAMNFNQHTSTSKDFKNTETYTQDQLTKMPTMQSSTSELRPGIPCYSIKYLGVTKGQIGILSKRAPIPFMSPLETCKDVPMTLINSSVGEKKSTSRILNKILTQPMQPVFRPDPPEEPIEKELDEDFPNPEAYDEFVIHTYARPKALVTVHKDDFFNESELIHKPVEIPYHRVGISGWKLSRPKSSNPRTLSSQRRYLMKPELKYMNKTKKHDLPEYYNEPYLKFIAEKRKNTVI
ncbi:hypothetical protein SteCoe_34963 [Stentor coeruleus]|uniref:Uncharacterized protein n=1 Tax=Stentor coeruleus TaxID=5963 RepID=A0A1R2ATF4_9CILI|nr:hypothetical protein SteCoe_34963 [Stentor coeruleus]